MLWLRNEVLRMGQAYSSRASDAVTSRQLSPADCPIWVLFGSGAGYMQHRVTESTFRDAGGCPKGLRRSDYARAGVGATRLNAGAGRRVTPFIGNQDRPSHGQTVVLRHPTLGATNAQRSCSLAHRMTSLGHCVRQMVSLTGKSAGAPPRGPRGTLLPIFLVWGHLLLARLAQFMGVR